MYTKLFVSDKNAQIKAITLFGRTEETAKEDVTIIKEWLLTQKHLPETMEEVKIANFLLLNKHSIEKTKQKIDMYYTIRSIIPDIFQDSNPKSATMTHFMETCYCCVHPKPFEDIYRVFFLKMKMQHKFAPREFGLQCCNICEIRLYEDCMVGEIIIFDMSTMTLSDLTKITPTLLAKLIGIYEKVFSLRAKGVYIVNSPPFVVHLMSMVRPILKPKIFGRIQIFQDCEILKTIFEIDELPKDYGGKGPSLDELNEMMKLKLQQYKERFDEMDSLRVDESLRPQTLINDEILGFHGNFKKLNVD